MDNTSLTSLKEDNQTYTNNNAVRSVLTTSSGQEVNGLCTSNEQICGKEGEWLESRMWL